MLGLLYKEFRLNLFQMMVSIGAITFLSLAMLIGVSGDSSDRELYAILYGFICVAVYIVAGIFEDGIFAGDERRKWAYYIASTPLEIKGQVGIKYLFTLIFAMFTEAFIITVNSIVLDFNSNGVDISLVAITFFYIQLFMHAIEFPLIIRFGGKTGGMFKVGVILLIVVAAFAYFLFGDLSALKGIAHFINKLINSEVNPMLVNKIILWSSAGMLAVLPLYYLSYRISVKLYLKGVENYAG